MLSVNVRDRDARQFDFRYSFEATKIDAVHLSDGRLRADSECADAAVLAEVVLVLADVEQVLCQLCLTRQKAKAFSLGDGGLEARSTADRTIAAKRALH